MSGQPNTTIVYIHKSPCTSSSHSAIAAIYGAALSASSKLVKLATIDILGISRPLCNGSHKARITDALRKCSLLSVMDSRHEGAYCTTHDSPK